MRALACTVLLLLGCASCVFAGEIGGTVRLDLQLAWADGSPIADTEVRLVVNGFYGFRGTTILAPDMEKIDSGTEWLHGRTNERGHIGSSTVVVHPAALWALPPLGVRPRSPRIPELLLAVPAVTPHWIRLGPDETRVRLCDGNGLELEGDFSDFAILDHVETMATGANGERVTHAALQVRFRQPKPQ